MKPHPSHRRLAALTACLALLAATSLYAQQQFQGLCSKVKINIQQELTVERIGFEATLEVTDNDGADPITDFSSELTFRDVASGEDASALFFVQPPTFENIDRIDGTGVIGPTKKATVRWFLIPKITAGSTNPQGKAYAIGCRLAGKMRGAALPAESLLVIEDTITVKPEPQLEIYYFQPRDVTGDDPFTAQVETAIPFTLGVLVHNAGYGSAKSLKINSQQPKIVENKNGLLLVARLLGARVQDSPLNEASLLVDLGDINPGQTRKGAWDMITTLSGEFIDFKASYTHADELGGRDTSVIKSIHAYFIAAEVINDEPGRDRLLDFLADTDNDPDMIPDTLFETDGAILPVNHLTDTTVSGSVGANNVTVTLNADREGWGYMRLDDPAQARYPILQVTRSDGKVLHPRNCWTNIRYRKTDNQKLTYLNLFDRVQNGQTYTYSITYQAILVDTTPPLTRLRFAGDVTEAGGNFYTTAATQLYFTAEDASPVSILYRINGAAYRPGLPFTLSQPGTYVIDFYATDLPGNVEAVNTATVIVPGADAPLALTLGKTRIFPTDLLSTRPGSTPLSVVVPASAVATDGQLQIFQGVIAWPRLAGMPPSPTSRAAASLTVSGQFAELYRYRVNGGAWSDERPAAQTIDLSGLSGAVAVSVLARHSLGSYPDEAAALTVGWTVNATAPALEVAGVPATPGNDALNVELLPSDPSASLYRWTIANGYYRAEAPLATPLNLPLMTEGTQVVSLIARRGSVWQDTAAATQVTWTYDKGYGFQFNALPVVRSVPFPNTAGHTLAFNWDGRNDAGVAQIPGPYTVLVTLTDALGNKNRVASLVVIEGLSASQSTLADSTTGARRTRACRDWAVWQENASGFWNIRARNLAHPAATVELTHDTAFNQENPATDGTYVVWQSRRSNNTSDILWKNLATGESGTVAVTPTTSEVNPSVDWPWVVYQVQAADNPSAPWQIEAWNALTNQRFRVWTGVGDQFRPRVQAGRVVWEDHRDVGAGEVYFSDLETHARRRITTNPYGQNNPVIYGDLIAWQDNRNGQVDIYQFDLLKGVEQRVTNTPYNEINPELSGTWLMFQEDSMGPLTENLRLLDTQTGSAVALTRAATEYSAGSLGNGFAVWTETLDPSHRQVVASFLPGLQPISVKANTLALTQSLTDRFATAFQLLAEWGPTAGITAVTTYDSFAPLVSRTATFSGTAAGGVDFPLLPGSFLWVEFGQANMADLGAGASNTLNLAVGLNAFSYTGFPVGTTAYGVIDGLGAANLHALRFFDAFSGRWRAVEISTSGERIGPDFAIPRVATLLLDLTHPVNAWKP